MACEPLLYSSIVLPDSCKEYYFDCECDTNVHNNLTEDEVLNSLIYRPPFAS